MFRGAFVCLNDFVKLAVEVQAKAVAEFSLGMQSSWGFYGL